MESLIRIIVLKAGQSRPYADTIDKYQITTTRQGGGDSGAWDLPLEEVEKIVSIIRRGEQYYKEGEPIPHPFVPIAKFEKEGANRWIVTITSKFTD